MGEKQTEERMSSSKRKAETEGDEVKPEEKAELEVQLDVGKASGNKAASVHKEQLAPSNKSLKKDENTAEEETKVEEANNDGESDKEDFEPKDEDSDDSEDEEVTEEEKKEAAEALTELEKENMED